MRNARGGNVPDVEEAARICVEAGAHGITLHPRPDGRHALASDVYVLKSWLPRELNVEGNPFEGPRRVNGYDYPGFMELLRQSQPTQATLVPDAADQQTSDHGWPLTPEEMDLLQPVVTELQRLGCRVSLFMDPNPEAIQRAKDLDVNRIELYTEEYADAFGTPEEPVVLNKYVHAANVAKDLGLGINAGHDLNQQNLGRLLQQIPEIEEVSIGQALVADALLAGLERSVARYLDVIGGENFVSP